MSELLARCRATSDHAERAALWAWVADELDASALAVEDAENAENVVALQAPAEHARRLARRERAALARAAAGLAGGQRHLS